MNQPLDRLNTGTRLDVVDLSYKVWSKKILANVSFSILKGELVGLLGPSGSGKSTLLKSCCGLIKPSNGKVLINSTSLYENTSILKDKFGFVPQDDIIHTDLSVEKAVYYSAKLRLPVTYTEDRIKALVSKVIAEVGLQERAKLKIKKLSGGQRKRASIAVELLSSPSLLFLDEPTSGQDPQLEEALMKLFKNMSKAGTTIIVTTHAMASVEMLDLIILIQAGNLIYFGPPQDILDFFDTKSYEGVFKNMVKNPPEYWFNQYMKTPSYQAFLISRLASVRK